jgi:glycosyltransferase involved in cell wall biosynthesis
MPRIGIVPAVDGPGGMTSFRLKFEAGLRARGFTVTHAADEASQAILVIGGTRQLLPLWRAVRRGVRVVQRLDGINWIQRRRNTGARHYLRAEYGNFILALIRRRIASHILYQSEFARRWWDDWYGLPGKPHAVVHNGVDLKTYSPEGSEARPADRNRLLVVEGDLGGGYDMGLDNAVRLAETLISAHQLPIELTVVGKISPSHQAAVQARTQVPIQWMGAVPRERIPAIDRSAHVLFSSDLNPACPNSVIEAMACGLPVVAFDTGALRELVVEGAGEVVPYGGDPWKLEKPDIAALAAATARILREQAAYRRAARRCAESFLDLDIMTGRYLKFMLEEPLYG